ncbi:hypothetical protein [Pelagibacterium halotolerans]|uniref:Uncharacterized protein n=1 Tax=Pelagibacterium halotolerans (strain DSM 22347 / JCM 15775 / CGMCC 1.7692 / B2) TaxID=1082931 RepID=G4RG25_PELHB|nr:hypothetical protein [Pelagibacterium halotolerans]AEQ52039.1 hypothetical protein KKY_2029 [Pelagibacterium halotolerans B2]SDZ82130.1 hypothetical protein SAMN05428936_101102 [Pelagibacterium halotolerans]
MKLSLISAIAALSMAAPGAALAQEVVSCDPQTIAQLLGLEPIAGCEAEITDPDGEESANDRLTGLLTAHEASGGRSTEALDHANTMSGGAVLAADMNDDDDEEEEEEEEEIEIEAEDEDEDDGRGRPDDAGRGRP